MPVTKNPCVKVTKFLSLVRRLHPDMERFAQNGGCFRLHLLLAEVFPKSEPWYDGNHVITKIGDVFYDITGVVEPNERHIHFIDELQLSRAENWDIGMCMYKPEHLQSVRDDPWPLVDRLRGHYGGRVFANIPAIQIVAADEIESLRSQIKTLTERAERAEAEASEAKDAQYRFHTMCNKLWTVVNPDGINDCASIAVTTLKRAKEDINVLVEEVKAWRYRFDTEASKQTGDASDLRDIAFACVATNLSGVLIRAKAGG